jgi:hypothetical protein
MSWLQVLYQLCLRVEEFSFSRFLRFGHFGLWSGCEERVRHTCESRLTLPVPGFARREIVCMGVARGRSKCLCWELSCQPLIPIGKLVARGDVFRTITPALIGSKLPVSGRPTHTKVEAPLGVAYLRTLQQRPVQIEQLGLI